MLLQTETGEVVLQGTTIDLPPTTTRPQIDPGHTRLTTPYTMILFDCHLRPPEAAAAALHADDRDQHRRAASSASRSEEHTSELQSRGHLVCRLLLEKKNQTRNEAR